MESWGGGSSDLLFHSEQKYYCMEVFGEKKIKKISSTTVPFLKIVHKILIFETIHGLSLPAFVKSHV